MSNLENMITRVTDFMRRYTCVENIRIRFTLGKYNKEFGFEKHIFHEDKYEDILKLLNNCNSWDKHEKNNYRKYKNESKIIDSIIILCENGPYDIIVTAETKRQDGLYISEDFELTENVYVRKNHTFIVSKYHADIEGKFYTCSIIPVVPDTYTINYIAHSSLLKIQDLIHICDDKKTEFFFTHLNI